MKPRLMLLLLSAFLSISGHTAGNREHEPYPVEDENRLLPEVRLEPRLVPGSPFLNDQLDSVESLSRLLQNLQERLADLLNRQNGLASRHQWEFGARIDRDWNGRLRWVDLKSSKGTGNTTAVRITNRTVICFHTHPRKSIPQLSYHDRENARKTHEKICEQCRKKGIPEPEAAWFVTVHEDGEMWAWRPGMNQSVQL